MKLLEAMIYFILGIIIIIIRLRRFVKDRKIRSGGETHIGTVIGAHASRKHAGMTYFYPIIKIDSLNIIVESVRDYFLCLRHKEQVYGEKIIVIYNTKYPHICTFGKKRLIYLTTFFFCNIGALLIVYALRCIMFLYEN